MDLTIVFSSDKLTPAKKEAIDIAQRHGAKKSDSIYKVKFDKRCKDLTQLVDLCFSWKLSHILIKDEKYSVSDLWQVLYCENRRKCDGECEHGYSAHFYLIDEIENCVEDPDNGDINSEWMNETVSDLESFEKQQDGTFKIKKDLLKQEIEKNYVIPINVCDKFDLNKIFARIDALPNTFSIPTIDEDNISEYSSLDDDQRKKIIETAQLVAPIYAKAVAKELELVILANFGSEKTASDYLKKADALFCLQRHDESLEHYNKALELYPANPILWNDKAFLLEIGFEDYQNAAEAYGKAFELDPNNIEALHRKGICFDSLGMEKEAIAEYEKAIELFEKHLKEFPNDEEAKEHLVDTLDNLSAFKEQTGIALIGPNKIFQNGND